MCLGLAYAHWYRYTVTVPDNRQAGAVIVANFLDVTVGPRMPRRCARVPYGEYIPVKDLVPGVLPGLLST
jgi:hypothetical protein